MPHNKRQLAYGIREFDLSTARDNERVELKASHFSVLRADADAEIRIGNANAAAIPVRKIESINLPESVERIYLSNSAATSGDKLVLLNGLEGTSASAPDPDSTVDVSDDSAREVGKVRVQESGGTLINPATSEQLANQSTVNFGQQSVATAGTAEALNGGTSLSVPDAGSLTVRADVATSGDFVYVGDSGVTSSDGFKLADGEGVTLDVDDVSTVHVDADTAGDGVSWIVEG